MLDEAHQSSFSIHPGSVKMYKDLKPLYWWPGMKSAIADYVSRCLTCQKVKVEHRDPTGLLQPLKFPKWKWERITMDFISGLPVTPRKNNSVWVIVDRFTKSTHFIPVRASMTSDVLGDIYIRECFDNLLKQDDKRDVSTETTGPAQADLSAGLQTSTERLAVLLAYP
ncbi:hypothetical protein V6N11_082034 [Hibiscus sabdariffa]|uniref:Integrase zinc-binding domain-containing protein n=1 Tax=Hibiscus sabdariffa TaxID=183260 RepID=A0ABR2QGU3_9ROSI